MPNPRPYPHNPTSSTTPTKKDHYEVLNLQWARPSPRSRFYPHPASSSSHRSTSTSTFTSVANAATAASAGGAAERGTRAEEVQGGERRAARELDPNTLKKAYREALLRCHPDKSAHLSYPLSSTTSFTPSSTTRPPPTFPTPDSVKSIPTTTTEEERGSGEARRQREAAREQQREVEERKKEDRAKEGGGGGGVTVDDVRLAYAILSDEGRKRVYDDSLLSSTSSSAFSKLGMRNRQNGEDGDGGYGGEDGIDGDEVEGLEVLDLADFTIHSHPHPSDNPSARSSSPHPPDEVSEEASEEEAELTVYTLPCHRCGSDPGFRVDEGMLESALSEQQDGGVGGVETGEVVVGCLGCSLFVRVGFGVEG